MIEIFLEAPMELQVIVLSCLTIGIIQFIKDEKEKNRQEYESKKSIEASKKYGFYRQNYCGCEFSIRKKA